MKKLIGLVAVLLTGTMVFAEKSLEEILRTYTDNDRVPDYNYSVLAIDNIAPNGTVEHLIVNQYGGGGNDLKNVVFDFKSPASVKNTRVLQAQKVGRQDERWIYLPNMKTVRRIPMSERYKAFVGTEFTYNDMTLREYEEDNNEMLAESEEIVVDKINKYDCWKIKSTPIKKSEVEYGYRISWFHKETYIPVRIEFYDKKDPDKLIKLYQVEKLEMVKGVTGIEYPLRRQNLVTNLVTNRKTRIKVTDFKFDDPISNSYFTQNWIQTGKAK
ncbi:MAG: outer membrane lipoprotein-sorting protein [Treponema sp.]|nr:outer membrane lipoprotein-sorting protein [Candidatus Treponema equifaecale]